jgi:hypothetical protein
MKPNRDNKMEFIFFCILISILGIGQVYAEDTMLLKKINETDTAYLSTVVKTQIAHEMNMSFPAHFDKQQAFKIVRNGVTQFILIPVSFYSMKAKNSVCTLSIFSAQNQPLGTLPLHYIQGDGEEIIESCIGVQSVAILSVHKIKSVVYLLRNRFGNQYKDAVFVGSIKLGMIEKNEAISNCASDQKDISSLEKVRTAIQQCIDSK